MALIDPGDLKPMNDTFAPAVETDPAINAGPKRRSRNFIVARVVFWLVSLVLFIGLAAPIYLKSSGGHPVDAGLTFARYAEQAVVSYYNDNNILPIPPGIPALEGGNVFATDTPEGLEVVNILAGLSEVPSPRQHVKYLVFKEARNGKDGFVYSPDGTRIISVRDRWGNPYMILIDTSYEERIVVPLKYPVILNGRRCAVYSAGCDGILGTRDDIKTWN